MDTPPIIDVGGVTMFVIEFSPPMMGIEGHFNTVRLGTKWSKCLNVGDRVLLVDKRKSEVMKSATVEAVAVGKLGEMAQLHAAQNHNQRGLDATGAPRRLIDNMIKRYGPNMCDENKRVTVIYLRAGEDNGD